VGSPEAFLRTVVTEGPREVLVAELPVGWTEKGRIHRAGAFAGVAIEEPAVVGRH
jgi:hypothetical protein